MGWRESLVETAPYGLAWGGLAIGMVFGALVEHTRFCAMGAVSDWHSFGDARRLRAWLLATAVALLGAQGLQLGGVVDLNLSMYLAPRLNWLGNILGGLLFGIGMVFAGGCGSRNLVRLGGGDLRAAVVLVMMGVFAYVSLGGLLGPLRNGLEQASVLDLPGDMNASLVALLGWALPLPANVVRVALTLVLAGVLLLYCLSDAAFRASPRLWAGGVGVGLCVCAAWALTGLAYDEFADAPLAPQGLSFVRPVGDSLEYLQRYTAAPVPDFGVATVLGTVLGAGLAAWRAGRFKLVGFADSGDTLRNLAGAALMGIGGVVAMGCSIGQSVSGVSTLAAGSLLAAAALLVGGVLGLRMLERMV